MQHTRPLLNKKRLFSNMSDEISNRNRNGNENRNGNNKQKKNSLFGGMTSNQDYASVIANRLLERNDHGGVDADKKPIQPPSILSKFVLKMTEELLGNNPDLVLTPEIDLEDYVAAIEKCDTAININPNLMEAYFNRGIAKEMTRDLEGACLDWQRAFVLGSQRAIEYLNGSVCNE